MIKSKEEGWCVYHDQIEAIGNSHFVHGSATWEEADAKAFEFVKARAAGGSELHQKALAKAIEYKLTRVK